ncbi:MAG: hypothetical protein AAF850_09950 [Pseudomonadota bacterium]
MVRTAISTTVLVAAFTLSASCETAKKLAPPGFIRYENIAGDTPVNPQIAEQIAQRDENKDSKFPTLAEAPSEKPIGDDLETRAAEIERLLTIRALIEAAAAQDQTAYAREVGNTEALDEQRRRLLQEVEDIRAKAAKDPAPTKPQ